MNILLTGASGQLGRELRPQLASMGKVIRVDRDIAPGDGESLQLDLGDDQGVDNLLDKTAPQLIVNAAAYTAVDPAEDDRQTAFRVNADLPARLARWAAANDSLLLHYSTDYVFSGDSNRPYREEDPAGPLSVYGESKLAGEQAVRDSGCRHLLLRTSWVYSGHGSNFLLTMLRLATERPSLGIVDDQVGCPTWARNLASASRRMLESVLAGKDGHRLSGLYHYCDGRAVSWFEFARAIFATAERIGLLQRIPELEAVTSEAFQQKAKRPGYSVLDVTKINRSFGIEPPGLSSSLQACLREVMSGRD